MQRSVGSIFMVTSFVAPRGEGDPDVSYDSFDREAARRAMASVAIADCSRKNGPSGVSTISITFERAGHVSRVSMVPPFAGTTVGACVASRFRAVHVRE